MAMLQKMNSYIKKLFDTGFFHIVGSSVLNRIIQMFVGIVLVRILSKEAYGMYAYAYNIFSFFLIFNGFGAISAMVQICSEQSGDERKMYTLFFFGYRFGALFNVAMGALIVLVALVVPLSLAGGNHILLLYALFPLGQLLCEVKTTQFRVTFKNKEYAYLTNTQTILFSIGSLVGAYVHGPEGLAIGSTVGLYANYLLACRLYPLDRSYAHERIEQSEKRDFLGIAGISAFNNGISQALTLVGTFLVGALLASDVLVASYKVTTTIPFALLFIPNIVVTYIFPHFTKNHDNKSWTIRNYMRVTLCLASSMLAITLFCCVLAEPITLVLFGDQYLDSVPAFRIMMLGFFAAAAFVVPTGNLLITQRKLLYNTFVGIVSIVANIALSFALIPTQGTIGAALAYSLTMCVRAVLNVAYYLYVILRLE